MLGDNDINKRLPQEVTSRMLNDSLGRLGKGQSAAAFFESKIDSELGAKMEKISKEAFNAVYEAAQSRINQTKGLKSLISPLGEDVKANLIKSYVVRAFEQYYKQNT